MRSLYAAYNAYGDLIADSYSVQELCDICWRKGYEDDEFIILRVTP